MDRREICEHVDAWFADGVEPGESLYNSDLLCCLQWAQV